MTKFLKLQTLSGQAKQWAFIMSFFSTWGYSAYINDVFDSVSAAAVLSVVYIKILGKEPNPKEARKWFLF